MDSPLLQSSHYSRMRANSTLSVHPVDSRGAVQKRTASRHRSISATQVDRLHQLALQQSSQPDHSDFPPASIGLQWLTPQHSPQPQVFPEPAIEPFPEWTAPTPPRSDSGLPTLSVDSNEGPVTSGISSTDFDHFEHPTTSEEMSSLGFLLPSQYGSGAIESEPNSRASPVRHHARGSLTSLGYTMDQNYIPPMRMSQPATTGGLPAYSQTVSSSPALYQSRATPASSSSSRRHSELPGAPNLDPSYHSAYRRTSNPYESTPNGDYSMASSQTIPSIGGLSHSHVSSPSIGTTAGPSMLSQYNPSISRSPSMYESSMYGHSFTSTPSTTQQYVSGQSLSYPPPFVGSSVNEVLSKPLGNDSSMRVLNQRPKPQCWEHGCNGRQFSTFSNLLRHQREKSGSAAKSYCPKCGAEFTRTTARNGHLQHDKCTKQRRQSEGSK